jgi:Protein of unknown function (DUF3800)
MHFYYLDEAGCTGRELQSQEQPIFVSGGISIRDEGWNRTQGDFARIINNYFEGAVPARFELHTEELLSPNGDGPFAGHDRARRNDLAKQILRLLQERRHDVHIIGIDKQRLSVSGCAAPISFAFKIPLLLAYDYLITYIDWFVSERLGRSARGMIILDSKPEFIAEIESITHTRRFEGAEVHRVKHIVEFSYPVDSRKKPMVQLPDLVVYCTKKFYELEGGYRENWPEEAKNFYAECYGLIDARLPRKELIEREGRGMDILYQLLRTVRSEPAARWKRKYGID